MSVNDFIKCIQNCVKKYLWAVYENKDNMEFCRNRLNYSEFAYTTLSVISNFLFYFSKKVHLIVRLVIDDSAWLLKSIKLLINAFW